MNKKQILSELGTCYGVKIYAETTDKLVLSKIERYLRHLYDKQDIGQEDRFAPIEFLK